MARKDKDTKKIEPPPPPPPPVQNTNSVSGSEAEESDSDVVSSSSSDAAPPTTTTPVPTAIKRTLTPHHHHHNSQPEPNSDSESDDDTPPPPPPPKPTTTTKQPRSKPLTPKRPAQPDNNTIKGSEKRPKKDSSTSGPSATTPGTPGKVLFQRLWSDEDEIVILKGMIEYKEKKGVDPMTHVDDFLDFIKKSLHVADANKAQIMSKVRRLKKRFVNAQKKKLTDPHELTAFELSKKIWRGVEEVDEGNHPENGVTLAVATVAREDEKKGGWGNGSVSVGGSGNGEVEFGFLGEEGEMVKAAMRRMGDGERKEMKKMVEKAKAVYLDGYLLRLKVLEVAAKKLVEGIRSDQG